MGMSSSGAMEPRDASGAMEAMSASSAVEDLSPVDMGRMPCSDEAPCHTPAMPSHCPIAAPCAPSAILPAMPGLPSFADPALSLRPAALEVRAPLSHPSSPESPPPRA